jgi:arsenate reductase
MGFKIFHNPRCSKSRKTLEIINEKEISIEIIEYLKAPPSGDTLRRIIDLLEVKPRDIMRTGESIYKEKNLNNDILSDDELIDHMIENPILIERPIVFDDQSAIIGRPPENVLKIISN